MRTTLEIDDDVYFHARQIAEVERIAIGKVVSRLIRNGLSPKSSPADANGYVYKNGIPVLGLEPTDTRKINQTLIDTIRDEEGI